MALSVQQFVNENMVFLYPTYSLKLVPCAFFVFQRFDDTMENKAQSQAVLDSIMIL